MIVAAVISQPAEAKNHMPNSWLFGTPSCCMGCMKCAAMSDMAMPSKHSAKDTMAEAMNTHSTRLSLLTGRATTEYSAPSVRCLLVLFLLATEPSYGNKHEVPPTFRQIAGQAVLDWPGDSHPADHP